MMKLTGISRAALDEKLKDCSTGELIDLIFSLSTVEELLTPAEIAAREKRDKRAVIIDMKAGKYGGGYFAFAFNSLRVSASSVNSYRLKFFVPVKNWRNGNGR
ncbi:MAG: hypothetical protein ABI925_11330 [Verrucomicrobiota bacterium]